MYKYLSAGYLAADKIVLFSTIGKNCKTKHGHFFNIAPTIAVWNDWMSNLFFEVDDEEFVNEC